MQELLAFIISFFAVVLSPFQPSANKPYPNKNIQIPKVINTTTPVITITITPISNSNSKSAVVDFKDLAAKQKEIDEYKKTDACYISFVESNYKNCPPGCAYQAAVPPDSESSAPVNPAKCGTRADYLRYY